MARVTGIGGIFFRAANPEKLAEWYETHLGISKVPSDYDSPVWTQEAGPTVFAPFPDETDYFGSPENQWMLNLRVDDQEGMAARLGAAGIAVEIAPETYPNGRFAHLSDPEGNRIELWQPA